MFTKVFFHTCCISFGPQLCQPAKEAQEIEKISTVKSLLTKTGIALCKTLSTWRSAKGVDLSENQYNFAFDHEGKADEILENLSAVLPFPRCRASRTVVNRPKALSFQKQLLVETNLTNICCFSKTCIC